MKTYRRIEVNSFRHRVTIVSGEWRRDDFDAQPAQNGDRVSLNENDSSEAVTVDSPEGQLILAEAVRTLERRLTPNGRTTISAAQDVTTLSGSNRNSLCAKVESLYQLIRQRTKRGTRR